MNNKVLLIILAIILCSASITSELTTVKPAKPIKVWSKTYRDIDASFSNDIQILHKKGYIIKSVSSAYDGNWYQIILIAELYD